MNFQDLVNQLVASGLPADSYTPETLIEVLVFFLDGIWEVRDDQFYWKGGKINGFIVDEFGWHQDYGFYDWGGYPIEA